MPELNNNEPRRSVLRRKESVHGNLFCNQIEKSFVFEAQHKNQTTEIGDIKPTINVQEHMAECRVAISGPTAVLRQAIQRLEGKLAQMEQLYYLGRMYADRRSAHAAIIKKQIQNYQAALSRVESTDNYFMPSRSKFEAAVEFMPMNLHLQQLTAWTDTRTPERYEIYTAGSLSTHNLGYKEGGLGYLRVKLAQQLSQRCANLPMEPSPTAAYWHNAFLISEQMQRVAYVRSQLNKAAETDVDSAKSSADIVKQLWDIFAQMKACADNHGLADEVKMLADAFESFCKQKLDEKELNLEEYEVIETENTKSEEQCGAPAAQPKSPTLNPEFELEALETQYGELEAHMACVAAKADNLMQISDTDSASEEALSWCRDFRRAALIALIALDRLGRTLTDAWNFRYLVALGSGSLLELYYRYEHREDALISQGLSLVATGIAQKLWLPSPPSNTAKRPRSASVSCESARDTNDEEETKVDLSSSVGVPQMGTEYYSNIISLMPYWERLGIVIVINSLLSCYRDEKCMIDDVWDAVKILRDRASVRFVRSFSVGSCLPVLEGGRPPCELRITVPVPAELHDHLPEATRGGCPISLRVFLFNQGINENQSLAQTIGDTSMEFAINDESFNILSGFADALVHMLDSHSSEHDDPISRSVRLWRQMISELGEEVNSRRSKNVAILHFASRICRLLQGVHVIMCKSGKDRTAMSATLEEAFILQERFGLPDAALQPVLDELRSRGTRIDNVRKNALLEYYAFTGLQLKFLPELYRPPKGFYKAGQT